MHRTTMASGFGLALLANTLHLALAQPFVISTLAGGAPPPTPISAINASIPLPSGVAVDPSGNVYFTSDNCVFRIDTTGTLTRVAGNSRAGYSGDGGPAASAQLNAPHALAIDPSGNIYIADSGNNRIRQVAPNGVITTVAGSGAAGYSGDGAPAPNAQLNSPLGVALDPSGNLYIADSYNQRIRKVSGGVISTLAGDGNAAFLGDNGLATKAELYQPEGVAVDPSGNLYIADLGNNRVRRVTASGTISTVAGTGSPGYAGDNSSATTAQLQFVWSVALDAAGNLYIADADRIRKVSGGVITTVAGTQVSGFSGDGGPATKAQLNQPFGIAVDSSATLYIADHNNNRIRKALANGNISTLAGDGTRDYSGDNGPAAKAQLYSPQGVALAADGSLYLADYARIRKISPTGAITTVAGNGIPGYFGDSGPATSAQLNQPEGIALDAAGNIYVADSANNRVRKVLPSGAITTVAGIGTAGYTGDGGPATSAQLSDPEAVAVDAAGNLFIADTGNACIRKVTSSGGISTVAGNGKQGYTGDGGTATAAQLNFPRGIAVDATGNLYIADFGNNHVRQVTPNGVITSIAGNGAADGSGSGGPATSAGLSPQGVSLDTSGNLYIADLNNLVWKVSQGAIIRIAGNGTYGYSGDGGSAVNAQLTDVRALAVDQAGDVDFADTSNYAIRQLRPVAVLLAISTASLPPGSVGAGYSQSLTATGGTPPFAWSLVSGTLPAGLSLSAAGVVNGTPTAAGAFTFTVQVTDGASAIATQSFTLTISVPSITTFSVLLQGAVGLTYSQALTASGGAKPYIWTLISGSLPNGLSLSPAGAITGTPTATGASNFTVKLTDSAGNTTTQAFTLVITAAPPLVRTGVLAHIAAGGSWTTTIYLANTTPNQTALSLALHADDGTALTLPITVTQQGAAQSMTASSLMTIVNSNATLVIDVGQQLPATITGWVDVLSSGPVSGFAIFRTSSDAGTSEGTSTLQTQFQSTIDLPYDNRSGYITAVALANLSTAATTVTATIFDPTGKPLGAPQKLTLPASGHTSALVPALFPITSGQQGIVQFQSSSGSLGGVGLRASPQGTFTSIPIL